MSELIRQSRYQFLLSSLESEHQRLALQEEYKFFTTTDPNRVPVPDDMTADQLTNHFKYSVAGLNAEAVYKSVTHELAHAFSWKIATCIKFFS